MKRWPTVPVAPSMPTLILGAPSAVLHMMVVECVGGTVIAITGGDGIDGGSLIDRPKPKTLAFRFRYGAILHTVQSNYQLRRALSVRLLHPDVVLPCVKLGALHDHPQGPGSRAIGLSWLRPEIPHSILHIGTK